MRIAAAQARPIWLDPAATTAKVTTWLEKAARGGVQLIAFPETFLSGYPFWLEYTNGSAFGDPDQKKAYAAYLAAGIEAGGPEIAQITEAARDLGIFVYLGTTERGSGPARGTIYCTLFAIDPSKGVVGRHRKLVPTYEERLVWGHGDGYGLRTHQVGQARVGGLNCWENWMPQARHARMARIFTSASGREIPEHSRSRPLHRGRGTGMVAGGLRPVVDRRRARGLPAALGARGGRRHHDPPRWIRGRRT